MKNLVLAHPFIGVLLHHRLAVRVSQIAIRTHRQRPVIFVPQSSGNGRNVNARFDAAGGKKMVQVVVGNSRDSNFVARSRQGFIAAVSLQDSAGGDAAQMILESVQRCLHVWDNGHPPNFAVFGPSPGSPRRTNCLRCQLISSQATIFASECIRIPP